MSGTDAVMVTLTLAEWQLCLAGLGKLPIEVGINVFGKLQRQLAEAQIQIQQRVNGELRQEATAP